MWRKQQCGINNGGVKRNQRINNEEYRLSASASNGNMSAAWLNINSKLCNMAAMAKISAKAIEMAAMPIMAG